MIAGPQPKPMCPLVIYIAPVTDAQDLNDMSVVVDGIHDSMISYTYAPKIAGVCRLLAPGRTRVLSQRFYFRENTLKETIRQRLRLPAR